MTDKCTRRLKNGRQCRNKIYLKSYETCWVHTPVDVKTNVRFLLKHINLIAENIPNQYDDAYVNFGVACEYLFGSSQSEEDGIYWQDHAHKKHLMNAGHKDYAHYAWEKMTDKQKKLFE